MSTPRIGRPVAASTGSPQVSRSRSERDQGAMPDSNAEAILSDAYSVVIVDPPTARPIPANEGASGYSPRGEGPACTVRTDALMTASSVPGRRWSKASRGRGFTIEARKSRSSFKPGGTGCSVRGLVHRRLDDRLTLEVAEVLRRASRADRLVAGGLLVPEKVRRPARLDASSCSDSTPQKAHRSGSIIAQPPRRRPRQPPTCPPRRRISPVVILGRVLVAFDGHKPQPLRE